VHGSKIGYSYSCLLARLPEPLASQVRSYGLSIPDERIYDDDDGELGREDKPHITVKYGIHTKDLEKVRKVLKEQRPVKVQLGSTSVFYNDDYVVVKIAVDGDEIRRLNRLVSDSFECTDSFPEYRPHVTVAYVKKDETDPHWFNDYLADAFDGREVVLDKLTFSVPSGQKYTINLEGKPVEEDTMKSAAKKLLKVARELIAGEQYESVNDAAANTGIDKLESGNTEIWYMKPSFFRDGIWGYDRLADEGELPDPRRLSKTHILLGEVKARNLDEIFYMMQGDIWSPRGEARSLIRKRGLQHTSMSVGDVIKRGSKAFLVDVRGFKEL